MRYLILIYFAVLMSCGTTNDGFTSHEDPFVFDKAEVERASAIAIMIPGALAPIDIFSPTKQWKNQGYALAFYRFPGLDGLPLDHNLGIQAAADNIAAFANGFPNKKVRLLGYSTGGPIAILAGEDIKGDVKVAAMSSAVELAGGAATTVRATYDIVAAAARAKSLRRDRIWHEYYRTLLYGRKGLKDPSLVNLANQIAEAEKANIIVPDGDMPRAHSGDLQRWRLNNRPRLPERQLRFFIGLEDPVFSTDQTRKFARAFGHPEIRKYPHQGHLLFLTQPDIFDDILDFFNE